MSATTLQHRSESAWRNPLLYLVLAIAAIVFLYRGTAESMVLIWSRSDTFAHGFLVLPIVLWLVWRKREVLKHLSPRPCIAALPGLLAMAVLWLLGDLASVNSVTQLAFVAMLVLAVILVLGTELSTAIAFPLGFLFFAVPIGEFLLPQLMEWTATFTVVALRATGIPVYRDGLQFVIPSGTWSVVEACSGVRYLIASLTVGTLFAYLNYSSMRRRCIFVGVAILVPVLANWARAYMIVLIGHLSGNTLAVGVDHIIYGWVFFGLVVMLMFLIGARWSEPQDDAGEINAVAGASRSFGRNASRSAPVWPVVVALLVVALPHGVEEMLTKTKSATVPLLSAPPRLNGNWNIGISTADIWKPTFHNPSREFNVTYSNGQDVVGLYIAYYRNQTYERKLISSDNVLVPSYDRVWAETAIGPVQADLRGSPVTVRSSQVRMMAPAAGQAPRLRTWSFYWLNGKLTSSDYLAKAYAAFYQLLGHGDDAAIIVLSTPLVSEAEADKTLRRFLDENFGAVDALLHTASVGK